MEQYALGVGEELVLEGNIHITLLAVEGSEALLGITFPHLGDLGGHGKDEGELPMTLRPAPLARDHQGQGGGELGPRWVW
jgi:hypothetical protein